MRTRASILTTTLISVILCLFAGAGAAAPTPAASAALQKATFAGGCFWCMEPPFEGKPGVVSVTSGYTGGRGADPTYEAVSYGSTGHAEAVEILFDPAKISYAQLLDIFWRNIDPTVKDRQFCDTGDQYRSAVFFHDAKQQRLAEETKAAHAKSPRFAGKTIHTEVVPAGPFYAAEGYHQDYATKNPKRYNFYRWNCGRDKRLEAIWGAAPAH